MILFLWPTECLASAVCRKRQSKGLERLRRKESREGEGNTKEIRETGTKREKSEGSSKSLSNTIKRSLRTRNLFGKKRNMQD